jgi:hypothetical protein
VTCGFTMTAGQTGVLGPAAKGSVVNVALKGGLTTVLMILDQQQFSV